MLLISFCNERFTPACILGLLEPKSNTFRWVDTQYWENAKGASGLASRNGHIYVGIQAHQPGPRLHIYDEITLELMAAYDFRHVQDLHSIAFRSDRELVAVSTGSDELYSLSLETPTVIGSEQLLWRLPGTFAELGDQCHVNSAAITSKGLSVTWCRSAGISASLPPLGGGVMTVDNGEIYQDGIVSPHSLLEFDGNMYLCAHPGKVMRLPSGEVSIGGFARGLCVSEGKLYAGSSGPRTHSRSTGRTTKVESLEEYSSFGALVSKIDPHTLEIEEIYSLRALGNEIYDILPVKSEFDARYVVDNDPYAERALYLEYHLLQREPSP